eukprot:m.63841 g.63841  ORF g.63841 m.63841 type:complete len:104 (-) comp11969_c0_seq2:767-1078(-)
MCVYQVYVIMYLLIVSCGYACKEYCTYMGKTIGDDSTPLDVFASTSTFGTRPSCMKTKNSFVYTRFLFALFVYSHITSISLYQRPRTFSLLAPDFLLSPLSTI